MLEQDYCCLVFYEVLPKVSHICSLTGLILIDQSQTLQSLYPHSSSSCKMSKVSVQCQHNYSILFTKARQPLSPSEVCLGLKTKIPSQLWNGCVYRVVVLKLVLRAVQRAHMVVHNLNQCASVGMELNLDHLRAPDEHFEDLRHFYRWPYVGFAKEPN